MGAWIEIRLKEFKAKKIVVAPFMGAWIEINPTDYNLCVS